MVDQHTIWCLDFDGVICNSANETGTAGWKCCDKLWSEHDNWAKVPKQEVLAQFCKVRPVLESGWEAILLVRMLATGQADVQTLLDSFQSGMKENEMKKLKLTEEGLVLEFNTMRKTWISEDEAGWLDSNTFYPEAVEAARDLVSQNKDVYIITTKAAGFTRQLLKRAGIAIPEEKIFGQGSGKKWATIQNVLAQPGRHPDSRVFFLEDRLKALEEVQEQTALVPKVVLALADWGYCMPEAVQVAKDTGMTILNLQSFQDLCSGGKS
jgi:phosphoglycolate phosphatase-like HAD superfamily hydrolase